MIECSAILFDLDGVLVDSQRSIERSWTTWAERKQLDPRYVLSIAHGRRTLETVSTVAPDLDSDVEVAELARLELSDLEGTTAMPGAVQLAAALPPDRWAVVTSGLRDIALARIRHAGLPVPGVLITADQIARGKPFPDGYIAAAAMLRIPPLECVVVEDAPPGVEAAHAAGMRAIAVLTTYGGKRLLNADFLVAGVQAMGVVGWSGGLKVYVDLATDPPSDGTSQGCQRV